jgi:hypothetical protein
LVQIAEILKTSTDYLLGLTDNPYPKEPTRNAKELLKEKDLHWDGVPNGRGIKTSAGYIRISCSISPPKAIQEEKEKS